MRQPACNFLFDIICVNHRCFNVLMAPSHVLLEHSWVAGSLIQVLYANLSSSSSEQSGVFVISLIDQERVGSE